MPFHGDSQMPKVLGQPFAPLTVILQQPLLPLVKLCLDSHRLVRLLVDDRLQESAEDFRGLPVLLNGLSYASLLRGLLCLALQLMRMVEHYG